MTAADPFSHDDAAYVFGALAADERRAFEAHLETCLECTSRVAQTRTVAAQLAGLDESAIASVDVGIVEVGMVDSALPDTLLPALLRAARRERSRRRGVFAGLTAVAVACAVALVVALSSSADRGAVAATGRPLEMSAVVASTVHASAILTTVGWGTQIELDCRYDAPYSSHISPITYSLVVVDRRDQAHLAGSWALVPGRVTHFVSGTALARDQIAKVEIVVGSSPILALTL